MTRRLIRVTPGCVAADANLAWLREGGNATGAVVCFSGHVRDDDPGDPLLALELQHYPGMTEKQLSGIADDACKRWPLLAVSVDHRVGIMVPGDLIVHVAVASAHRHAAFEACAFLMDWLKVSAPFWKLERRRSGASWVQARESDTAACERWMP